MAGCIISGDRELPGEQLHARAAQAAQGLEILGVTPGDAVAICLRNDIPFLEATFAARMLGAYPAPINWHGSGDEVGYVLNDCGAKALVVHTDLLPNLQGHIPDSVKVLAVPTPPEVRQAYGLPPRAAEPPDGVSQWSEWLEGFPPWQGEKQSASSMIYTSGTTGRPKGVRREINHPEREAARAAKGARVFGLRPGMRTIIPAPMYHTAPNVFAVMAALAGGTIVLQPRFDPEQILEWIERYAITHIQLVPTMLVRLLKLPEATRNRYDLSKLEHVVHAAAPCAPEVKRSIIEWWGPVINEYYGSTEAGFVTYCNTQEALDKPGTVGKPLDNVSLKILDDGGNELPAGGIGEVFMWDSDNPQFTYHGQTEKRRAMERDGLITTGDIGFLDEDGWLFLCDRKIDMVISGGVNIYPAEIEAALVAHPDVEDSAVFGVPHPEFGESLMAVVQPRPGSHPGEAEIQSFLGERLAGFKVPPTIEFQSELPREDSGKIFKRKLREPHWEGVERRI